MVARLVEDVTADGRRADIEGRYVPHGVCINVCTSTYAPSSHSTRVLERALRKRLTALWAAETTTGPRRRRASV